MEYVIMFIIIISISIVFTQLLKRKIDEVIPITVISMTLLVYIAGLFNNLKIGVYILIILFIISLIYIIIKYLLMRKKREKIKAFDKILTPGLFIYTIIYIIYIFISKDKIFTHFDEFSHWGVIIKHMYIFNDFGTNPESFIQYSEYPPFTAVFEYIFLIIKNSYSETTIITTSNILYISIIIPVLKNITWKSDKKTILLYFITIIFLPMLFFEDFYDNILVDGKEAIFFGISLYSWYSIKDKKFRNLTIILLLISLGLIKSSGVGLVALVIVTMIIDTLSNNKNKKDLINLAIIILTILLFISTWYIKINTSDAKIKWEIGEINLENIQNIKNNEIQIDIIQKFFYTLVFEKILTGNGFTYVQILFILVAISIYIIKNINNEEKRKYKYHQIMIFVSIIIYTISLLLTYIFIIPEEEALGLASFERYISTILLGDVIFLFAIISSKDYSIKTSRMIAIICILVVIFPITTITGRITDNNNEIEKATLQRKNIEKILKYKDILNENDKIYYFSNKGSIAKLKLYTARYIMMPLRINNIEMKIASKEQFQKMLLTENYTHLYLFELTMDFKNNYKELFPDKIIKEKTMYKINNNNGNLELIEL